MCGPLTGPTKSDTSNSYVIRAAPHKWLACGQETTTEAAWSRRRNSTSHTNGWLMVNTRQLKRHEADDGTQRATQMAGSRSTHDNRSSMEPATELNESHKWLACGQDTSTEASWTPTTELSEPHAVCIDVVPVCSLQDPLRPLFPDVGVF